MTGYTLLPNWLHPVAQPSCAKSNVGICMGGVTTQRYMGGNTTITKAVST